MTGGGRAYEGSFMLVPKGGKEVGQVVQKKSSSGEGRACGVFEAGMTFKLHFKKS